MFLDSDAHSAGLVKYRDAYPFGVDPSWRGSRTELPFLNSLKMKMSILLGVAQMNLGIILSYFDARFFGNSLDIRSVLSLSSSPLFPCLYLKLAWILQKWCIGYCITRAQYVFDTPSKYILTCSTIFTSGYGMDRVGFI